jgi:lincosamide nucleotidyltransferase A/C/D/E
VTVFPAELALEVLGVVPEAVVDGGWGVDALIGKQTRDHDDLDIIVPIATLDATLSSLTKLGFAITLDEQPTRVVVARDDGAHVDLHLVGPSDAGPVQPLPGGRSLTYALGTCTGRIGGRDVPCLAAPTQLVAHSGYESDASDHADMSVLRDRLGVSLPPPYVVASGGEPIRRASADDAAALVVVRHRSWLSAYDGVMPKAVLDALDPGAALAMMFPLVSQLPSPRHCALVAGEPGSVIGEAVMGPSLDAADPENLAVIYQLYVDPNAFGLGIGKRLLDAAVDWLREPERAFDELTLWVLEGNVGARRFYEREGWRADGARKTETQPEGSFTSVRYRVPLV